MQQRLPTTQKAPPLIMFVSELEKETIKPIIIRVIPANARKIAKSLNFLWLNLEIIFKLEVDGFVIGSLFPKN